MHYEEFSTEEAAKKVPEARKKVWQTPQFEVVDISEVTEQNATGRNGEVVFPFNLSCC